MKHNIQDLICFLGLQKKKYGRDCNKANKKKINIFLKNVEADLIFSSGYPYIIPKNVLIKKKIFLNSHPGLLPKYKGRKSIPHAYYNEEKYIGCTVHYINENIDDGKIIYQKRANIKNLKLNEVYQLIFSKIEPQVVKRSLKKVFKSI